MSVKSSQNFGAVSAYVYRFKIFSYLSSERITLKKCYIFKNP